MLRNALLVFVLLTVSSVIFAQDATVTVPDLTGMNAPQAAAALNKLGLKLGAENNQGWTAESGLPENTISTQSIPAGQAVAPGTAIDVNVLRSANTLLIYDDNDLTLVNRTGGQLDLVGLSFAALDGNGASLTGSRWAAFLRPNQCVQVWSVGRNGPKGLDECEAIQNWLVTTQAGEHFWTGGVTQFAVYQNGVQRAVCPVTNPGRCEFFLAGGGAASDTTEYVYYAYTTDRMAIINKSDNRWMALAGYNVYNYNSSVPGAGVPLSDPTLYPFRSEVASLDRLAPGQCLYFTNSAPTIDAPPEACDVVGKLDISAEVIFWGLPFEMDSQDGQRRTCPAATAGRLTICVMPR